MSANEEQLAAFAAKAEERLEPYIVAAEAFLEETNAVSLANDEFSVGDDDPNAEPNEGDIRALALLLQAYEQRGWDAGFEEMMKAANAKRDRAEV